MDTKALHYYYRTMHNHRIRVVDLKEIDFGTLSVVQLIRSENPPEHIVVETSGVSDPVEVARTFCDPELLPYAPLEGIVTVVDAELAPTLEDEMLHLAKRQIIAADVTVLNKVDLVDDTGRQVRSRGSPVSPRMSARLKR